jgi:hypothetical protein
MPIQTTSIQGVFAPHTPTLSAYINTCMHACAWLWLLPHRTSYSLSELDLSNNPGITGVLPPQLGLLKSLKLVKYTATNLSCAGITQPYVRGPGCVLCVHRTLGSSQCAMPNRCRLSVIV